MSKLVPSSADVDAPCTPGLASPASIFDMSAFRLAICRVPSALREFMAGCASGCATRYNSKVEGKQKED